MKITKKAQYGILFAVYLSSSGRATTEVAAANLGLSESFLQQVARTLRLAKLVTAVKGPHGGYELNGNPTVGEVLGALSPVSLLTKGDYTELRNGGVEQRAFALFVKNLRKGIEPFLSLPIREVVPEKVKAELRQLDWAGTTAN